MGAKNVSNKSLKMEMTSTNYHQAIMIIYTIYNFKFSVNGIIKYRFEYYLTTFEILQFVK